MKYDLIAEAYVTLLIEGRIDDLKAQNPHLVNEIDSYVQSDPTPQKKFVPWLVSQHKKGNVTPDTLDLNQTLSGFETYKSRHGIRDHSSKTYQEIKDVISPFIGTAVTNKELKKQQIHEGIEQIYNSPDNKIQAFHVKTKEASQHVYGGGKHLGGLHTDWCVAARANNCVFGNYGRMYTVHVADDLNSPYAVHPEKNIITDNKNSGDRNIDMAAILDTKIEYILPAIHKILAHYDPIGFRLSNSNNLSDEEINLAMQGDKRNKSALFKNKNESVLRRVISHPMATENNLIWAADHYNPSIAKIALHHINRTPKVITSGINNKNPEISDMAKSML